jgi:hypothetical protein
VSQRLRGNSEAFVVGTKKKTSPDRGFRIVP